MSLKFDIGKLYNWLVEEEILSSKRSPIDLILDYQKLNEVKTCYFSLYHIAIAINYFSTGIQ